MGTYVNPLQSAEVPKDVNKVMTLLVNSKLPGQVIVYPTFEG